MAKRFKKKCKCHGKVALVDKVPWKQLQKNEGEMYCLSAILESKQIYSPYIPLLEVETIKTRSR